MIVIILATISVCNASSFISVLPIIPTFNLWLLLIIIAAKYILYCNCIRKVSKSKLLLAIFMSNLISTILGIIFGGVLYLILDYSNSELAVNLIHHFINKFSFIFKNRFFWTYFITSLLWTLCSIIFAFYLTVYFETKFIYNLNFINDEKMNIIILYKVNLLSFTIITIHVIFNLYLNAISVLLN